MRTSARLSLRLPQDDSSITGLVASLDEQTAQECRVLMEMMQRIGGHEPQMWNVGTIGFDTYHYKYDSGCEGASHPISFYPRRQDNHRPEGRHVTPNCWLA